MPVAITLYKKKRPSGFVALVDEADAAEVSRVRWLLHEPPGSRTRYAKGSVAGKPTFLHRFIMRKKLRQAADGLEVDHRDGDGLNNTRLNLQLLTHAENIAAAHRRQPWEVGSGPRFGLIIKVWLESGQERTYFQLLSPREIARARQRLENQNGELLAKTPLAAPAKPLIARQNPTEVERIGNPLTLTIIEFFAVPCALIGALLYPLGLDGFVWHYLGAGIELIFWAARQIAAAPGATLYLRSFAPWSILFLTLAVLSVVIWKSWLLRATALIFLACGLIGAASGESFDLVVAPGGDVATFRLPDGKLAVIGARPDLFAAEQWLRADGDGREAHQLLGLGSVCDKLGCVGRLSDGSALAVVMQAQAFEEDCLRADILVTPLRAPATCAAPFILDRARLAMTGAVALRLDGNRLAMTTARSADEDRPWSRLPRVRPVVASKGGVAIGGSADEPEAPGEERAEGE